MNDIFFIINDVDRPDSDHVCQLTEPNKVEYISKRLRNWNKECGYKFDIKGKSEITSLFEFGFKYIIIGDTVRFTKVTKSTAVYKDGKPRPWQGLATFALKIKEFIE